MAARADRTRKVRGAGNLRRDKFIVAFIETGNSAEAARRAGYSPATAHKQGSRLLTYADIRSEIERRKSAMLERAGITAEKVIEEIGRIAFADPRQLMTWGPGGVALRKSEELTDAEAALVSEVSQAEEGGAVKIKLWNKLDALEKLAKHLNLYGASQTPDGQGAPTVVNNVFVFRALREGRGSPAPVIDQAASG